MSWSLSQAAKLRDILTRITAREVAKLRPTPRYATVVSWNRVTRKCIVNYPEDPSTPIEVNMGVIQPSSIGQRVRIEGVVGDKYITDIMGPAYIDEAV